MKALITGSREWINQDIIHRALLEHKVTEIMQGGATGADCLAWRAALTIGIAVKCIRPDWNQYGKAAGVLRNAQMLREFRPDIVLAFWDGQSRGTRNMIDLATQDRVPTWIYSRDGSCQQVELPQSFF
jgi:hypothetical protein